MAVGIMNIKPYIPNPHEVVREGLIVIGGVLIAAYVLSKFPKLQAMINASSVTVKNTSGDVLY